jgi:4-hydroxythreonine-4-phosphate dehydrogenase
MIPRIVLTPGEPAGIGPDLAVMLSADAWPAQIVVVADPGLLAQRAEALGVKLAIEPWRADLPRAASVPGRLVVSAVPLRVSCQPGVPDVANAAYVLETLRQACQGCERGEFDALVTAPVHKGIINDAGFAFSGHTELLAELTGSAAPVMMLVAGNLRVALLTTHLPLREVPDQITGERIERTLRIVHDSLENLFGIVAPRIAVLGLNPHAGESGHLGSEELDIIAPTLERLRAGGLPVIGPLPADSAFTRERLVHLDAVLAMYHDQGLPVLKHVGFRHAVNITLGLPIVRTSVDHGTALELAGTGQADAGSLRAALRLAIELATRAPQRHAASPERSVTRC